MSKKPSRSVAGKDLATPQFMERVSRSVQAHLANPSDNLALREIREVRRRIARFWITADVPRLKMYYQSDLGKAHQAIVTSEIQNQPLEANEQQDYREWCSEITSRASATGAIRYLLAAMLYRPADMLPSEILQIAVPPWFLPVFVPFLLRPRNFYAESGDVERFHDYMDEVIRYFHAQIFPGDNDGKARAHGPGPDMASLFMQYANLIPLYFGYSDLKDIMIRRADIIEAALLKAGCRLDTAAIHKPAGSDRIRLGILNAHYKPQTETYATLPVFEHIDRDRFEVILFATELTGQELERYCQNRADRLIGLPKGIAEQMRVIRDADLDVLFFGSNITAVSNSVAVLASSRMAPIQVASICSPVTTGAKNIDYYVAGDLTVSVDADQMHYTERLAVIPGSGLCFSYAVECEAPTIQPSREWMGISEDSVVYVSGANFFKLTPEVREGWARIIAEVPNSLLVLYPFNPYWSRSYQASELFLKMQALFARYGIDQQRLVMLKPFPQRADIKELLKLCDIYLDAYPYGGATSIIDPLQVGLPPVVMQGEYLRFRQASALLSELGMEELIVDNEPHYRSLSVMLGRDHGLRQRYRAKIMDNMRNNPPFMDSSRYSRQMGRLFENLCGKRLSEESR